MGGLGQDQEIGHKRKDKRADEDKSQPEDPGVRLGPCGLGDDQAGKREEGEHGVAKMMLGSQIEKNAEDKRQNGRALVAELEAGVDDEQRDQRRAEADQVQHGKNDRQDHLGQQGKDSHKSEIEDNKYGHGS